MSNGRYRLWACVLALILGIGMVACGSSGGSGAGDSASSAAETAAPAGEVASGEEIQIVFSGLDCVTAEEQQKPKEEWVISQLLRQFEEENPGVSVEITLPADYATAHQAFKVASLANNAPDVANLWGGQNVFRMKEAIVQLDDLVPPEDMAEIFAVIGTDTREGFAEDGALLAYPFGRMDGVYMLYNKKLVEAAGLDFEADPPLTVDQFDAACQKILDSGVTPLEVQEGTYPSLAFHFASMNWFQQSDHSLLYEESFARAKYTEDKGFLDAFAYYRALAENGFLNKDFMSSKEMISRFLSGKAAMIPASQDLMQVRGALGDDLGAICFPSIVPDSPYKGKIMGGVGQTLVVAKSSKYPEVCVKLMSFLNRKESSIALIKNLSGLPIRRDITLEDLGMESDLVYKKYYEWSQQGMCFWFNATIGPEVSTEIQKLGPLVLNGEMTVEAFAEALDNKVVEINK